MTDDLTAAAISALTTPSVVHASGALATPGSVLLKLQSAYESPEGHVKCKFRRSERSPK